MRLIDADVLLENQPKGCYRTSDWINVAPTIDAIPVEWIKALTNHSDMFTRGAAKWVLGCWKKEKEAR